MFVAIRRRKRKPEEVDEEERNGQDEDEADREIEEQRAERNTTFTGLGQEDRLEFVSPSPAPLSHSFHSVKKDAFA